MPKDCFVDRRDFGTHDELYAYLRTMGEEPYQCRLDAIAAYLRGSQWHMFSDKYFAATIAGVLRA